MQNYTTKQFQKNVYRIVQDIPKGYVLTYGRIALLAGRPNQSRMVGRFLAVSSENVPAHRVVNHQGRTVPGWNSQTLLLKREGVSFKPNGNVNLRQHLWRNY